MRWGSYFESWIFKGCGIFFFSGTDFFSDYPKPKATQKQYPELFFSGPKSVNTDVLKPTHRSPSKNPHKLTWIFEVD